MAESAAASNEPKPLSGRRVLIVEDEYFLADDIGRGLRSLGAEIAGPVGYLQDGFDLLDGIGILDGAVLDVNIGNEMIFPLARELRKRDVPFLFTSGYDGAFIGPEFAATPRFEKPIDLMEMSRALADLIQNRRR